MQVEGSASQSSLQTASWHLFLAVSHGWFCHGNIISLFYFLSSSLPLFIYTSVPVFPGLSPSFLWFACWINCGHKDSLWGLQSAQNSADNTYSKPENIEITSSHPHPSRVRKDTERYGEEYMNATAGSRTGLPDLHAIYSPGWPLPRGWSCRDQKEVPADWLPGTSSPLTLLLTCGGVWLPVLASCPQSWERGLLSLPGCKLGAPCLAVGKASLCCVLGHGTENPESPASIQTKSGGSSSCLLRTGLGWGCSPSFPVLTSSLRSVFHLLGSSYCAQVTAFYMHFHWILKLYEIGMSLPIWQVKELRLK